MRISPSLANVPVVCINLKKRPEKRKAMMAQFKRRRLTQPEFFLADAHKDPKRGCLESHLAVIKMAVKRGWEAVLILEDDAQFVINPEETREDPPDDWDMLFLGGTVKNIYESTDRPWVRMGCWTTHAYLVRLTNKKFVRELLAMECYDGEVDRFYLNKIHPKWKAYMVNPMVALQKAGYSDIEGREVSYEFMAQTLATFQHPEHEERDGQYVLKLPTLEDPPGVTIVTPTYNRRRLFPLAIRNFLEQDYPSDRLEWIIVDDSDETDKEIDDLIPTGDPRIRHEKLPLKEGRYTVAYKRNLGARLAKYDIVVHMDDDDYYPPSSVFARVALLEKYPDIGCVGCSSVAVYDLVHSASTICTDGTLTLSEASMAYRKSFWQAQPFLDSDRTGEYFSFIKGRYHQIMDVPYEFIIYALTHYTNLTQKMRQVEESQVQMAGSKVNWIDLWDEDTQFFMSHLLPRPN